MDYKAELELLKMIENIPDIPSGVYLVTVEGKQTEAPDVLINYFQRIGVSIKKKEVKSRIVNLCLKHNIPFEEVNIEIILCNNQRA